MRGWLSRYAGAVLIAVIVAGVGAQPAAADDGYRRGQQQYLALGDSLPFGYNPLVDPPDAAQYVGYPERAAARLKLALTNASCPGQTSSGFIKTTGTDNGCFGFRQLEGAMHTAYSGSQLQFAVSFLRTHPHTKLVTLTLGANDLILCPNACAAQADFDQFLTTYERNLRTILMAIRKVYHHQLLAVTYYSPDYRNQDFNSALSALNAVTTRVIRQFHGTTADGFTAFATIAARSGGDTCAAGLLIRLPDNTCDIHPSAFGARILARTLTAAIRHHKPDYHDDGDRDDSRLESLVHSGNR